MARNLITLLGSDSRQQLALQELRSMIHDGVDVRLIADILAKAHLVMRQLGLDPTDTTAQEVYSALLSAVRSEQWLSLLEETDYVLLEIDGEIISFNPIDVVDNYHYELPLESRKTSAAKQGLGWEITKRYKSHPRSNDSRVHQVAERANLPTEEPKYCRIIFEKPSILTIGDIASEALITLDKDSIEVEGSKNNKKISVSLGAKIASKSAEVQDAVGGAANAAVAFSRLGVQPSLVSWLGDDTVGRQSLGYLRQHGVDMSGVALQKKKRSNYHYVLRHGAERTIIAQYETFDYRWREPDCLPDWLYLSMISGESWGLHEDLLGYLGRHPSAKLAFQPGASHISWGKDKLKGLLKRSEVIIMNVEEAMGLTERTARSIDPLLRVIHGLGPSIVVITDGPNGAFAYDGTTKYEISKYPDPSKPVDRTGAGDAFAATFIAELAKGSPIDKALLSAPVNSMNVVQHLGAQPGLLTTEQIDTHLKSAPTGYAIKNIRLVKEVE